MKNEGDKRDRDVQHARKANTFAKNGMRKLKLEPAELRKFKLRLEQLKSQLAGLLDSGCGKAWTTMETVLDPARNVWRKSGQQDVIMNAAGIAQVLSGNYCKRAHKLL
jgi:hypothetical protein